MYSLKNLKNVQFLTVEEEIELFKKYKEQDCLKSAEKIVISNLRYVSSVARDYKNYNIDHDDLFQQGVVGLMKAVKSFDITREVRFVSYAVYYIKSEILDYVKRNFGIVKTITTKAQSKIFFNMKRLKGNKENLSCDDAKYIAKELNVPVRDVLDMECRLHYTDSSTDFEINQDDGIATVGEMIANPRDTSYITLREQQEDNQKYTILKESIDKLDARSKDIFINRNLKPKAVLLEDLAIKYNISKERIRQINEKAFQKVQQFVLQH